MSVSSYIQMGTANPTVYAKAINKGKAAPFNPHARNFRVDLASVPLGKEIGAGDI